MQKWGNTNSLYLQCILKSYGVCAQPNVAIPWCKWSATFQHFRLASLRFTGTRQRQHRSCVHHRKKSTLISWRKVPPPWRHWCPGAQKWQNPDIFNRLKHSMCAAETMLSDGTFYSRTKLLTQIYTLVFELYPKRLMEPTTVSLRYWSTCNTWAAVCVIAWTLVTGLQFRCKKRCAHQLPWDNNQRMFFHNMLGIWRKV